MSIDARPFVRRPAPASRAPGGFATEVARVAGHAAWPVTGRTAKRDDGSHGTGRGTW